MNLVHLDSFYYYAPIPRVARLQPILGKKVKGKYMLLYTGFSAPQILLRNLIGLLYGSETNNIVKIISQPTKKTEKPDSPLGSMSTLLGLLLRGRRRTKKIKLEKLARIIDPEKLSILEFLLFLAKYKDTTKLSRVISQGHCPSKEISITRKDVARLRAISDPVELSKKMLRLYTIYQEYVLCKTCKLLGLKYPRDVRRERLARIDTARARQFLETACSKCKKYCDPGRHVDDIRRALALREYAEQHRDIHLYIATIAAVTGNKEECFTCLAECLDNSCQRIEAITQQ